MVSDRWPCVMLAAFVWIVLGDLCRAEDFVTPDLVGKSVRQARTDVGAADSTAKVVVVVEAPEPEDPDDEDDDEVVAQVPGPGTKLTLGQLIHVIVKPVTREEKSLAASRSECPTPEYVWALILAVLALLALTAKQRAVVKDLRAELSDAAGG